MTTRSSRSIAVALLAFALLVNMFPLTGNAAADRTTRDDTARQNDLLERRVPSMMNTASRFRNSEIIVQFADRVRPERIATNGRTVASVIAEYQSRDDVVYAEPNYIAYAFATPNDTYYNPYQWNFDNGVNGGVHAETAWDTTSGSGVIVAIVDTGVAYENYDSGFFSRYSVAPDLAGTTFVPGYDFVNNDTHPNDDEGHGTHVAGTIAGTTNNSQGVAGLAYGASIMPIKVLASSGSGSYADVADGIRWAADHGAQVINLSLGGPTPASYLEDAVRYAYEHGVTIVAASGNDSAASVSYPAAYDDYVIAVGATRFDETRASYSNRGSSLDLVAPGGDLGVDQNGDGYGDGILQQTFGSNPRSFSYYFYEGTSMATPHVAAAAALVISNGNATTPDEVRMLLENTADDLGVPGRDDSYGHGLINLAAALGTTPPPPPEPLPNQAPVADAGPDQSLVDTDGSGAESVTLDGTVSSDPDGSIVTYNWFEGASWIGDGVTRSVDMSVGTHTIDLYVTDNEGATSTDQVVITVESQPVVPPPPPPSNDLFADSFESGLGLWTQGSQGDWQATTRNSYDGRYSAEIDGRTTDGQLISPNISLGSTGDVRIRFDWLIEKGLDAGEYLAFDISTNGGANWTEYRRLRGNVDPENVWTHESETFNGVSQIRVRFRGTMSSGTEDAYVDVVLVESL